MAHWLIVLALTTSCVDYQDAYAQAVSQNVPLVVLLGADWCVPCQKMKKYELPQVQELLDRVAFAYIDVDKHAKLARELAGEGGGLPQTIAFWKNEKGWVRSRLVGYQNAAQLTTAITSWIAESQKEREN